ncbi:MAG: T9SS type A sorting domain-containing protein [Bacteroidota bacterium]|nr:T9SS type A sorting domain-containing protein [Bacteroidota bacterium]
MILSLTTSDSADLDLGGEGVNRVYGVSYIGAVSVTPGSNISTVSATECFDVSSNFVTIVRDSCSTLGFAEKIHGYSISVFPNPADQALYITTDVQFQQITVLNALGQRVMSLKNVAVGTTMLDISGLDKGVYYITLEGPAGNMRKSFVKQ